MPPASFPDIDRILEAIRAEARFRGAKGAIGTHDVFCAAGVASSPGLPALDLRHATDFLALPLDLFLAAAYRELLGREGDAGGMAHYQRALLRGKLSRMEVLGRFALSREARGRKRTVPGAVLGLAFATAYRIPLLGALLALAARALCLPAHCQDRLRMEAAAMASGGWMRR